MEINFEAIESAIVFWEGSVKSILKFILAGLPFWIKHTGAAHPNTNKKITGKTNEYFFMKYPVWFMIIKINMSKQIL